MASSHLLCYFLVLVVGIATIRTGAISKRWPSFEGFNNDIVSQELGDLDDRTDMLILRFIDNIIEDAHKRGVQSEMLNSMMRKRSGIGRCFFHAINCW